MKILNINTNDIYGGAARAAYRLHQGLNNIGLNSQMLVQLKQSDDYTVISSSNKLSKGISKIKPILDILPLQLYSHRDRTPYSIQWLPNNIASKVTDIAPDIINLHWICGGFIPIESLTKFNKPMVWTLHDMWAFTGGCHYSGECDRYSLRRLLQQTGFVDVRVCPANESRILDFNSYSLDIVEGKVRKPDSLFMEGIKL